MTSAEILPFPAPEQGPESELGQMVRAWLEHVIELAGLNLDVRTTENDTQVVVRLYGRDARKLIEGGG